MIKHIEEMRKNILNYKVLNDKKMFMPNHNKITLNKCNIILFGPSGSGKSSFIKTLYRAIYGNPYLPPDASNKLIIKSTSENEGTLCFTRLYLKEENDQSSSIVICDTRGHIWMDQDEKEQFKIIIEGNVKDDVIVKQSDKRNPYMLWQFWKKDTELFPKEIFYSKQPGIESVPHSIVIVVDGSIDDVINEEDGKFYKELVDISIVKGYSAVNVILTRIDLLEKNVFENNPKLSNNDKINMVNILKDQKIEKIIQVLGLKRSNIHFIENYHSKEDQNIVEIDYHALKTLTDIVNLSEQFLLNYFNRNYSCLNGCF